MLKTILVKNLHDMQPQLQNWLGERVKNVWEKICWRGSDNFDLKGEGCVMGESENSGENLKIAQSQYKKQLL